MTTKPAILYIDIETAPGALSEDDLDARVRAKVPKNYRSPEAVAKWMSANRADVLDRTALDSMAGRLWGLGWAFDGEEPRVHVVDHDAGAFGEVAALDALRWDIEHATRAGQRVLTWVGHNVKGFDLPWLWRLAVKHNHDLAAFIPHDKWGRDAFDTMEAWAATDYRAKVGLDAVARFLGVESTWGSGSQVAEWYRAGDEASMVRHLTEDVRTTRDVYLRIKGRRPHRPLPALARQLAYHLDTTPTPQD